MLARAAMVLSLLLLPLAATAQPWLPPAQSERAAVSIIDQLLAPDVAPPQGLLVQGDSVVPVWASSDGRWLALVALSEASAGPMLPLAPAYNGLADWRFMDAGAVLGGGLRWRFGNGFHIDALIGRYDTRATSAAHCPAGVCLAESVPMSSSGMRSSGMWSSGTRSSGAVNGSLGLGWLSPAGDFDLSYGVSWLQSDSNETLSPGSLLSGLPVLAVPGTSLPYLLDSSTSLIANGRWTWNPEAPAIHFGASYGHGSVLSANQPGIFLQPIDISQASLSLGIGNDTLRGIVVGRMLTSDDPAFAMRRWSALDLGLSWRTPWQGELSVGAQNVWSSADAAPAVKVDPAQARMPYIQYRQDL